MPGIAISSWPFSQVGVAVEDGRLRDISVGTSWKLWRSASRVIWSTSVILPVNTRSGRRGKAAFEFGSANVRRNRRILDNMNAAAYLPPGQIIFPRAMEKRMIKVGDKVPSMTRSEERRVGKECR